MEEQSVGSALSKGPLAHLANAFAPIRPRLALLTVLATGPLIFLLIFTGIENRNTTLTAARHQLEGLARLGAEQQDDVIQESVHLLTVLARIPSVQTFDRAPCHALLRMIGEDHPRISVLTAARPDGTVGCVNLRETVDFDLRDRPYIKQAMSETNRSSVISEIMTGKITKKPTVVVAVPIPPAEAGARPGGVMVASLNLDWFLKLAADGRPTGTQARIIDARDGTLIAQDGGSAADPVAQMVAGDALERLRADPKGGVADVRGPDGVDRVIGYAALPNTQAKLMLVVARPRALVLAEANWHLLRDVGGGLLAAFAAVLAAWIVANRALVSPVRKLAVVAGRVGQGDLNPAGTLASGAALELRQLGGAFDDMVLALQSRNAQIARIQAEIALSEEHHRLLSDNATDMITLLDESFHRSYVSPACKDILGYEPHELEGLDPSTMVYPDDRAIVDQSLSTPLRTGSAIARATYRGVRKDGRVVWLESGGRKVPDGVGYVVVTRDVSERKLMEEQLEAANRLLKVQAMQDPLTGVANRRRFDEMLGFEFRRAQRLQDPLSVIMLDIDHFKAFNDSYGHPAGDACLRTVATAIEAQLVRTGDLLGRYGGEEFSIVLPETDRDGALAVANRIRAAVEALGIPNQSSPLSVLTVSIGVVAIHPAIGLEGPAGFVEAADIALYLAKRDGRNAVRLAEPPAGPVADPARRTPIGRFADPNA